MRQALWIAQTELRKRWFLFVVMMVLASILGLSAGSMLGSYAVYNDWQQINYILLDFLFIAIIPFLGTLSISKEYMSWSTVTDEPFLRRLSFLRMWPIPLGIIVWSRLFYMLICFLVTSLFLFSFMTLMGWDSLSQQISMIEYVSFLLLWFGYGLATGGANPYLEFGTNGKTIIIGSLVSTLIIIAITLFVNIVVGKPLFVLVLELIERYQLLPGLLALVVGISSIWIWKMVLTKSIQHKDLP